MPYNTPATALGNARRAARRLGNAVLLTTTATATSAAP
jgi:hypothetical protein